MKVVAVTSHNIIDEWSGTPKHIEKIVSCLAKNGCEVIVLYLNLRTWSTSSVITRQAGSVVVYEIPPLLWLTASFSILKDFHADVCIAFTIGAACRFLPVLSLFNLPLLYEVHTVFKNVSLSDPVQFIYEQMEKMVCRRAKHIITLGSEVKDIYTNFRKVKSENISVIYPSVNVNDFKDQVSINKKNDYKFITVTYIGNLLYKNQGINLLLEAAKIVCCKTNNVKFVLAGETENAELNYKHELTDIKENVKFVYLKDSSEVPKIISESEILAHTRIYSKDNLSVQSKLAVYMASGKPIVATDFADYQYLIGERCCGYAVNPNPKSIAEAIIKLSINSELRQEMGLNSYKTALEYFNLSTSVEKYISLLNYINLSKC